MGDVQLQDGSVVKDKRRGEKAGISGRETYNYYSMPVSLSEFRCISFTYSVVLNISAHMG